MKKHKVKTIKGVKVIKIVKKDSDRPTIPPGVVFDMKTKYDRKRDKEKLRREHEHSNDMD